MQFQFRLDEKSIIGEFDLYIQGKPFCRSEDINILELAVQLGNWLNYVKLEQMQDFVFVQNETLVLKFLFLENGVQIYSPFQSFEQHEALRLEVVTSAARRFLVELNLILQEIEYPITLDRYYHKDLSENEKALMLFEQNQYKQAFSILQRIAKEEPSVQSLNNLAWMYLREEEDLDTAQTLLEQVLQLQPQSPFPFMMLGEIALIKGQFEQAKTYLQAANALNFTEEANYNLATAHFKVAEYNEAAKFFSKLSGDSGYTQLHEVVSLIFTGELLKAKDRLALWNEEAYDYTGSLEIADVYLEMQCYEEARIHFEKEWNEYIHSPYIVARYAYTLWKLEDKEVCQGVIKNAVQSILDEINDVQLEDCDGSWTLAEKTERIFELQQQRSMLDTLFERLQNGYTPLFEYDIYPMGGCQLFGCLQHGNEEY